MIRRVQALNYRCLRYVDVHLDGSFHILVGPNASGKSTLLDVVGFMGDLVTDGLDLAVSRRTKNFRDLVWDRDSGSPGFELAVEFEIHDALRAKVEDLGYKSLLELESSPLLFRYEVAVQSNDDGLCIASEGGFLAYGRSGDGNRPESIERDILPSESLSIFPSNKLPPASIITRPLTSGYRCIFRKSEEGADTFSPEPARYLFYATAPELSISFGKRRSTLKNLPEDPERFPVSTYVKRVLVDGVQKLFLDSRRLRHASSPNNPRIGLVADGSNLPWAIHWLRKADPERFAEWIGHIRTALRDLKSIRIVEREDDRHAYLMLRYSTDVEVPSWTVSDGTLRLLALTLAAYLPEREKLYLMEEPENGVHPMAIETVYQSLSSVYESQVLVATHSPVFLGCAAPEEILCFAKNKDGATEIIRGDRHPRLAGWKSSADMDLLFASEVLA